MIPLFKVYMNDTVSDEVSKTLHSGMITQGEKVEQFESKLIQYIGNPYVLTLNSATAGLTLALKLLMKPCEDLMNWKGFDKSRDIVLTPALTCFATTASILSHDVNIRWIDVDPETCNVCLKDIRNKLSPFTKVIYIVHWAGNPVDLNELYNIQEESFERFGFRPIIVEDCAHAFGSEYNGKKIGNNNRNICVFSLQAIKHLTTGDGGIITLPNRELYDRCKLLRWYGIDRDKRNFKKTDFRLENDITESGYKFHMNDIAATIGLSNIKDIDTNLNKCRHNAKYFQKHLKDIKGIQLMKECPHSKASYWIFTILINDKQKFIDFMKSNDIMTSQVHNRNDINSCVKDYKEKLPNLDTLEQKMVCIPVGWWLTYIDLEYIVKCIKDFTDTNK